jgi:hypothetical protein
MYLVKIYFALLFMSMKPLSKRVTLLRAFIALVGLSLIAACGGGGGSSTPTRVVAPPATGGGGTTGPTWTQGVFERASQFKDQCQSPRFGTDIEGNTFPDQRGSLIEETFWLRSWTRETYLWNREVVDRDPNGFNNRVTYFDQLRTTEVTPSGEDKDDFHFSEPTSEFLERRNSTGSASYGARIVAFSNTVPRDYRIQYTEPNSPASEVINGQVQLQRGTRLLSVDGVSIVNGGATQAELDLLNTALFPQQAGVTRNFTVQDAGANTTRNVTITSQTIATKPVNRTNIIPTPTGNVGYVLFNTFSPFSSEEEIAAAMRDIRTAGVTDLVLDLRYNGGGLLAVAGQLGYMIAGPSRTAGRTFELLRFNDDAGNFNPVTGAFNDPIPFYSTGLGFTLANGTPLPNLNLQRVFILSTERTCSASEAVINGLRGIDVEVILIGDTTCGKPFGFYPTDNCGQTYYTIQFQGQNDKGFGDFADGFVPANSSAPFGVKVAGCQVADDYTRELGEESEGLLSAALSYRETGSCPTATAKTDETTRRVMYEASALDEGALQTSANDPMDEILETNRDMRMPF